MQVRLGGTRRRPACDIRPGRLHPSMVAHRGLSTRIVVQIDTQQLPSTGTGTTVRDVPAQVPTCSMGSGFTPIVLTEGNQIFLDALTLFAERGRNTWVKPVV